MEQWIKTSERLPEFREWVLISTRHLDYGPSCGMDLVIFNSFDPDNIYFDNGESFYREDQITYWRPLPEPPDEN